MASAGGNLFNIFYIRKYVKLHLVNPRECLPHLRPILILFCVSISTMIYISSDVTDESTKTDVISPKTSDNSHILLWIGLVCLGAGLVVIGICLFKRRDIEK